MLDDGNILQVQPEILMFPDSEDDWDRNWISTKISIKAGSFIGDYNAEFMTIDFEIFKRELMKLYNDLNGNATLKCLEGYLTIKIKGDGIGHFEANCIAIDNPGINENKLEFSVSFDQTQIPELVAQLNAITREFPLIGEFNLDLN